MIYIVLLFLLFLWKFSDIRKGWLLGFGLLSIVVTMRGVTFDILTLFILIGLWRVALDVYDAGK